MIYNHHHKENMKMKKLSKYVQLLWKTHKKILTLEKHLELSNRTVNIQYKTIEDKIKTIERLEREKTYDELEESYEEIKDSADSFVNDVDDIANNMDVILDSDNPDTIELKNEVGKLLRLCEHVYF